VVIKQFKRGDMGKIDTTRPSPLDRDSYVYDNMEADAYTMYEEGSEIPIAAWGMQVHWEGVASVWSEFSEVALTKYPLALSKNVRGHLNRHIKKHNLHRVQVMILADDDVSIQWIEWLGFHIEGRMEQYVKDQDVLMYARLVN
jgi:hypothetical protein